VSTVAPETVATYDDLAARYAVRWADRADPMALDRDRFVRLLPVRPAILDLGCGPGRDLARFQYSTAGPVRAVGLDRSAGMLAEARRRTAAPLLQGDAAQLPLRARAVDGIWACASLLHLPRSDMPSVLAECARVLRVDGVLYVAVQEGDGERWRDGPCGRRFFTYWRLAELSSLAAGAGFVVEEAWVQADPTGRHQRWVKLLARRLAPNLLEQRT
jgi:SAM-dependent methyltransferase